jgi:UDP-N-acetylglucosamine 4,6-dehydratase/5-epimerase|tara:strand:- start:113 stop:1117 length:1005 start_codon:yes stop_codon:yes gene_type:complete
MFNNQTIFISGGTGSFGNHFIKKLIKNYKPKKIIIYSRDEYKQFLMQEQFPASKYPFFRFFLGDVRDLERLKMAMNGVDYVVHAAALKQVPAAEYNPMEFVKTNINGAENIIHAAIHQKVKKIIALSTDKAANPINLYGATKLASDKIFIAANNITGSQKTIFSVVRYGNVAGSRGSVIPYFQKLINDKKKYLPITHEDMTRFWITLEQAIDFVFMSFRNMIGGEIFVPKIPSVKIVDLAKAMAPNLKTKIVGIRPGEKIHELMCPNEYHHLTIEFKKYFKIIPSPDNFDSEKNFLIDNLGEKGKKVSSDFEYSSGLNDNFLSINQINKINKTL